MANVVKELRSDCIRPPLDLHMREGRIALLRRRRLFLHHELDEFVVC